VLLTYLLIVQPKIVKIGSCQSIARRINDIVETQCRIFSVRELTFTFATPVCLGRPSVVCLSSVTLVRPTQAVEIFGNISTAFGTITALPSVDIHRKFYRDRPRGNPPPGKLNTRG